jgi:thiol-disulfide isomerase/thioredoxin
MSLWSPEGSLSGALKISDWLGKAEFQRIVSEPGPHLVVFSARWCRYCKKFLEQASSLENPPDIEISVIDTDEPDLSLWDEFSIKKVPAIFVFEDGKSIFRRDGRSPLSLSGGGLKISDLEEGLSVFQGLRD